MATIYGGDYGPAVQGLLDDLASPWWARDFLLVTANADPVDVVGALDVMRAAYVADHAELAGVS